jgi:hypothetical protein
MEANHRRISRMKPKANKFKFSVSSFQFLNSKRTSRIAKLLPGIAGALMISSAHAQQTPVGDASHFTSVEYYPAPNQTQIKTRLSGSEAQPQAGGLLVVKQLKLESFSTNGNPQAVVEAPECIYDTLHNTANSAGHLQLQSGDGKIQTEGDGFLWRQNDSILTISNNVHTVIKTGPETNAGL